MIRHQTENDKSNKDLVRLESVWGTRHRKVDDFHRAQNGDHLLVPYECDLCVFRKLKGCNPNMGRPQDDLLLASI